MKTTIFLVIGMLIASVTIGQNKEAEEVEVLPPQLRYRQSKSVNEFFQNHLQIPYAAQNYNHQGTVVVEFVVNPDSKISDVKFTNGISPQVNSEVLRVLLSTNGKWNPGYVNKVATPMKQEIVIVCYKKSIDELERMARVQQQKAHEWMTVKNNPQKALKHFNRAISLLPYEVSLWGERALCKHLLGDLEGEKRDYERYRELAEKHTKSGTEYLAIKTGD